MDTETALFQGITLSHFRHSVISSRKSLFFREVNTWTYEQKKKRRFVKVVATLSALAIVLSFARKKNAETRKTNKGERVMATLFEITNEFERFYQMVIDEEMSDDAFEDTLACIMDELEVKASGYANVIKQVEMEAEQAEILEKEFKRKKEIRKTRVKRLKEAICTAMQIAKVNDLNAGKFSFHLKKNGGLEPLVIDKPEDVPDTLKVIKVENDNAKIREYLKDHDVDWGHLEERGFHVEVK